MINNELYNYNDLIWMNGYEIWPMIKFNIPGDGHCLFHALLLAFFNPYKTGLLNNKKITKMQIIHNLRSELAIKLEQPIRGTNKKPYDLLSNGNLNNFAENVPEFSLSYMKTQLKSNNHIGYGYLEFIANQINKDIYILNGITKDIYVSDESSLLIKGRNSIVLYYEYNHYELIGIKNNDSNITHFLYTHPFIQFLKKRIIAQLTKKL